MEYNTNRIKAFTTKSLGIDLDLVLLIKHVKLLFLLGLNYVPTTIKYSSCPIWVLKSVHLYICYNMQQVVALRLCALQVRTQTSTTQNVIELDTISSFLLFIPSNIIVLSHHT